MAAEDIPFLLSRIRVNAEWRWKGGRANDLTQLIWGTNVQPRPTQAQLDAEQLVVDAEEVTRGATDTATRTRLSSTVGKAFTALTTAEKDAILERLLQREQGVNDDGTVKATDDWSPIP